MVTPTYKVITGDALSQLRLLPDESVQTCVTSPPYWGLRDYGTATWEGGDVGCDHKAPDEAGVTVKPTSGQREHAGRFAGPSCWKCGARRVDIQIGLEKTPEEYVARLVEIFREVRRVLRNDGTLWLNLGDSYSGMKGFRPENACTSTLSGGKNHIGLGRGAPVPVGMKPKDLVGIPWMVAFALRADGWYLRSDIIWAKCLSGGARVYARTKKGEMPTTVKDLVRLNPKTVQLWNGKKWTQVVSFSETEKHGDELELILRSGERVGCTRNHLWPTNRGNVRADELKRGDVIDTCRLPEPDAPRNPSNIPDDVGWFIGLYIAEGSQSCGTIQIASHIKEVERFNRLDALAKSYDGYMAVHTCGGNAATANINCPALLGIINAYVSGRTAVDKHLNVRCWKRSNVFLRSILDGYLSGDGHWTGERWRLGFCNNDALVFDIRTLCARLGISIRLKRTVHTLNGQGFPGWRGELRDVHKSCGSEVREIVASRARKYWDIAVEDDPHTFALASGVLTHNSNPMPESVTDRPTKSHEYIFLLAKSQRYYYDSDSIKEPHSKTCGWFKDRAKGVQRPYGHDLSRKDTERIAVNDYSGRNKRSVWTVATQPFPGSHFATFPPKLIEPCILAGTSARGCCSECGAPWERRWEYTETPKQTGHGKEAWLAHQADGRIGGMGGTSALRPAFGSVGSATPKRELGWQPTCTHNAEVVPCVVLDPFAGSGTTGKVAYELGRNSILIEPKPEYVTMINRRLDSAVYQESLFT